VKIAITSQNRKTITQHVGRCRKFWVYDIENNAVQKRELIELPKEMSFHEHHNSCPHPIDVVDVIITASMGQGMARRLEKKGILGVVTTETDPEKAVRDYLDGQLLEVAAGCACN